MAKCECGKNLIDGKCIGMDEITGKLIFECLCGKVNKVYMGC